MKTTNKLSSSPNAMPKLKVGRPRRFDKSEVLDAATNVFWSKGYEGSSMRDLTEAMGINSPSLYSTFGDKHSLYLQAIEQYMNSDACAPLIAFESEANIRLAVKAFMKAALSYATEHEGGARGCFLGSCVQTDVGSVEGVQELLKQAIESTDLRLAERFELEKTKGVLSDSFPAVEQAKLMFDLRQGYVFRARAGLEIKALQLDLNYRVNAILSKHFIVDEN